MTLHRVALGIAETAALVGVPQCSVQRLYVSPREFATLCGLSRATVARMVRRCAIRSLRVGRRRLIPVAELRFPDSQNRERDATAAVTPAETPDDETHPRG